MSYLDTIKLKLQPIELGLTSIEKLQASFKELKNILVRGTRFETLADSLKANIMLILHFFENNLEELEATSLTKLIEKTMPRENLCENMKTLLRLMRDVFLALRRKNEQFLKLHKDFGYHNLLFIQLWKLKQTFSADITQTIALKLWTVFVYLYKISGTGLNVSEMLDFLATIVIEQVTMTEKENRPFEKVNQQIYDTIGYSLDSNDYIKCKELLEKNIPDFESSEFPIEEYQNSYIQSLNKNDLNYLFFLDTLNSTNPPAPILTPLHNGRVSRLPSSLDKHKLNVSDKNMSRIQISNNFQDMVSVLKSPETQLCSPMLKKRFEKGDKAMEFSRMYQWYKEIIYTVKLKRIEVNGSIYKMSDEFSKFARISYVLTNFDETMKYLDKIPTENKEFILKLFFKLLDQFIENELKGAGFESVQELFKDIQFMKSVLCLAIEFDSFITDKHSLTLGQLITLCEISYTNFWKVLYNFAIAFGKNLPSLLQAHIVEVEFDILLRGIWLNSEVDQIFSTESSANGIIIKRILNILAERLYLVTSDCNLNDDMKQQVWELTKHVIFPDLCKLSEPIIDAYDINLRKNVHLDWVILCCIYQLSYINKLYIHFKDICDTYNQKVLFAQPTIRDDSWNYYQKTFKPHVITSPTKPPEPKQKGSVFSRENANSTPVRDSFKQKMKNILSSPLVDNLNMKLEKRNVESFFNPLQLGGMQRRNSMNSLKSAKLLQFGNNENEEEALQPKALFNVGLTMNYSPINAQDETNIEDVSKDVSIIPPENNNEEEASDLKSGNVTPGFN